MNVLSLFDGISCGQVALERANIKVDKYYASEIEPLAIKVAQHNYPNTIQLGDIRNLKVTDKIDLIIGGSPCQSFSFGGTRTGMITEEKIEITNLEQYLNLKESNFKFNGQSYLFWEYVRLLKELNPTYFLLENVKMQNKWKNIITNSLGVKPILINSKLVSAQSRERLYWTNIPQVSQPEDSEIYLESILQNDIVHKYLPKTRLDYNNYNKSKVNKTVHKNTGIHIGSSRKFTNHLRNDGKSFTLRKVNPNGILDENFNIRYFTPIEAERLQTLPDNYTFVDNATNNKRYQLIGNGWTVDVIAHIFKNINQ